MCRLDDTRLDARSCRHLGHLQGEAHVVGDGHVRIERVVLEHHRDIAILRSDVGDVLGRRSRSRRRRRSRGRRPCAALVDLPATGRPDEDQELAVLDRPATSGRPRRAAIRLRMTMPWSPSVRADGGQPRALAFDASGREPAHNALVENQVEEQCRDDGHADGGEGRRPTGPGRTRPVKLSSPV